MSTENNRPESDNEEVNDKNIEVTGSQNRRVESAGDDEQTADDQSVGANHHHGGSETGSHQEGQYDKDHSMPPLGEQ